MGPPNFASFPEACLSPGKFFSKNKKRSADFSFLGQNKKIIFRQKKFSGRQTKFPGEEQNLRSRNQWQRGKKGFIFFYAPEN